jgi:hypothetical protein
MRCKACKTILNDYEVRRKDSEEQYIDLCSPCYRHSQNVITENNDVDVDSIIRYNDNDNLEDIL